MNEEQVRELMRNIDELTQYIQSQLYQLELQEINLLLDKRFQLLKDLLCSTNNHAELKEYLVKQLAVDNQMMEFIHKEQAKINHTILNINNLNGYLETSLETMQ